MRGALSSRAVGWLIALAGAAALLGGGALGVRLGEAASRPRVEEIRVTDPGASSTAPGIEARSPAGFTGFGGPPALEGDVLRRGTASDVREGAFTLIDGTARSQVEFTQSLRLYRISPAATPLATGDSVVVSIDEGRATAVLRVRQGAPSPSR